MSCRVLSDLSSSCFLILFVYFVVLLCWYRDAVEGELVFLGFIVMQNRVKPESKPTVETLNKADLRSVMVTGMTH